MSIRDTDRNRSKIMTLKEFIETYEGFDWENGEVVLIDQRRGKNLYLRKPPAKTSVPSGL